MNKAMRNMRAEIQGLIRWLPEVGADRAPSPGAREQGEDEDEDVSVRCDTVGDRS